MFVCELALELGKTIREMLTGVPGMSAHELLVIWPTFFKVRAEQLRWQQKLEGSASPEEFDREYVRTMGP